MISVNCRMVFLLFGILWGNVSAGQKSKKPEGEGGRESVNTVKIVSEVKLSGKDLPTENWGKERSAKSRITASNCEKNR